MAAFLRTTKILEEINLLFEEQDFELRSNKKLRKINKYKIQPVINVNGTITVVASYGDKNAVYITFYGDGVVELWPGQTAFLIDREKETPAEIRKRFRKMLETKYGFEFANGGHSALAGETISGMLLHPRIIPQIFKVFHEDDFQLYMYNCNIPKQRCCLSRLGVIPLPDGRLCITVGIENLKDEYSYANTKIVLFDGSDMVGICNLDDIKRLDNLSDTSKLHMVAIENARKVLIEQYGVSFDKEWRMNAAPVYDPFGIPYDPFAIPIDPGDWVREQPGNAVIDMDAVDKDLVRGYFRAERILNTIAPDNKILDLGFADCNDINVDLFKHLFDSEDE